MRKIFKLYAVTALLIATSCSKYVEDLNTDPHAFSDSTPEVMFQGVLLANQFWQNAAGARLSMLWMNQATGSDRQYVALNNWNSTTAPDFGGQWQDAYAGTITQAKILTGKALAIQNFKLAGATQVIEAYSIGMAAALWGDVPYSEAGNAEQFPNPKFDSQEDVYKATLDLLDSAIENLGEGGEVTAKKDIYYKGNTSNWIALAHALKARYHLHLGQYAEAITEAKLGMTSASGDMIADFGRTSGQNLNPFYSFQVIDRDGYMTASKAYAPSILDKESSNYRGNAKTIEAARYNYNYIGKKASEYNINTTEGGKFYEDIPLVTYGEMLLIIAEAEFRENGFTKGLEALNAYRSLINGGYSLGGVAGAFKYEPYSSTDFDNGGIENPDNISADDALLREILEERYVYFIGHYEAFNDFRRTKNGANISLKSGFSGTPERFLYPQSEINSNTNIPNPIPAVTVPTPVNK